MEVSRIRSHVMFSL